MARTKSSTLIEISTSIRANAFTHVSFFAAAQLDTHDIDANSVLVTVFRAKHFAATFTVLGISRWAIASVGALGVGADLATGARIIVALVDINTSRRTNTGSRITLRACAFEAARKIGARR
jgi:hypothetical protein